MFAGTFVVVYVTVGTDTSITTPCEVYLTGLSSLVFPMSTFRVVSLRLFALREAALARVSRLRAMESSSSPMLDRVSSVIITWRFDEKQITNCYAMSYYNHLLSISIIFDRVSETSLQQLKL